MKSVNIYIVHIGEKKLIKALKKIRTCKEQVKVLITTYGPM